MTFLKTTKDKLTRKHLKDISKKAVSGGAVVSSIIDYIDGNQRTHTQDLYVKRYCRRITKAKDGEGDSTGDLFYADPDLSRKAAVDSELVEVVVLDSMNKIVRVTASLNRDTEYKYTKDNGEEAEEFAKDITQARQDGGYLLKLGRLDELSVATGSSAILVQVLGSKLDYQPLQSDRVYIVHNTSIMEGSLERPTNFLDIEEATVIIVDLGVVNNSESSFIAYYPRSDEYPKGRMVKYNAAKWSDIPNVGQQNADDTVDSKGELTNPLTALQDSAKDWAIPEIPIALWKGNVNGVGEELLPTSATLYKNDIEVNLAACRALTANIKSATGMVVVSKDVGASPVMPKGISEATTILNAGQSVNVLQVPAANSAVLMDTIEKIVAYMSEAFGVPAYKTTISSDTTVPSGVALKELNKPEERTRQARANINRQNIDRIFKIEVGLAAIDNKSPDFGKGIIQTWTVNKESFAMSELDVIAVQEKELNTLKIKDVNDIAKERIPSLANATDAELEKHFEAKAIEVVEPPALPAVATIGNLPPGVTPNAIDETS